MAFRTHNHQFVFAFQIPVYSIAPETIFTLQIDPRNYFPQLKEQIDHFNKNLGALNYWTSRVKEQLDSSQGIQFIRTHIPSMCPSTRNGSSVCSTGCPYIHNVPLYYALMMQNPSPPPAKEQPEQALPAHPQQVRSFFAPELLKIDEYVDQPIRELNKQTDEEDKC